MSSAENIKPIRAISYGGGVQSTALIVLAATGVIDADVALMSNVGDDSELPQTLSYVREVIQPWASDRGFPVHLLNAMRHGKETTLFQEITNEGSNRTLIPVFGEKGNPLGRACTADFKVRVINRWLREHGAKKTNKATVLLGISTDEIQRAGRGKEETVSIREYPLLTLGLDRTACAEIIRDAGLPVPPKSSCFFCPFHSETTWRELRRDEPELFEKAQALEDHLQARNIRRGVEKQVYLTRKGALNRNRLSDQIAEAGEQLFDSEIGIDGCDSGFCWT